MLTVAAHRGIMSEELKKLARIEADIRELKAMMSLLVPSYADIDKKAAMVLGRIPSGVNHAKGRRNNSQGHRKRDT